MSFIISLEMMRRGPSGMSFPIATLLNAFVWCRGRGSDLYITASGFMVNRFACLKPLRCATTKSHFGMKRDMVVTQWREFGSAQIDLFLFYFPICEVLRCFLAFTWPIKDVRNV